MSVLWKLQAKHEQYQNKRKTLAAPVVPLDNYSIAHPNMPEIFGHGNLQVFRNAIFLHISFVKNKNRRNQIC